MEEFISGEKMRLEFPSTLGTFITCGVMVDIMLRGYDVQLKTIRNENNQMIKFILQWDGERMMRKEKEKDRKNVDKILQQVGICTYPEK